MLAKNFQDPVSIIFVGIVASRDDLRSAEFIPLRRPTMMCHPIGQRRLKFVKFVN